MCENLRKIAVRALIFPKMALKKCDRNEIKCSRFFGVFFRQVWGNLGKNPSHPQKIACSYIYDNSPVAAAKRNVVCANVG